MNIFEKAQELNFLYQQQSCVRGSIADIANNLPRPSKTQLRFMYALQQRYSSQPNKTWKHLEALLLVLMLIQPSVFGGERLRRGARTLAAEIMEVKGYKITRHIGTALFTYSNYWTFRTHTNELAKMLTTECIKGDCAK